MTPSLEILTVIDTRNTVLLLLVLGSGALCPDAPEALVRKLSNHWKRIAISLRSLLAKGRSGQGSFWEIDMTKFEP